MNVKVGDKVFSVHHGDGIVDKVDTAIHVIFRQGTFLYSRDGYYFPKDCTFRESEPSLTIKT